MFLYWSMLVSYLIPMLLLLATTPTTASDLQLVNNGFEGVLVAIDPMIDETYAKEINLLQAIKNAVTEGSQALFIATRNRAFFRKINILIPNSWNNIVVDKEVSSNSKDGHIHIKNPNPTYREQPYTHPPQTKCGVQSDFIHLTPKYITEDEQVGFWGKRGINVATEWARFRWGIFDEIGYPDDIVFPLFYQGLQDENEPTLCADTTVNGIKYDRTTRKAPCKYNPDGSVDHDCLFYPYTNNTQVKSSLLSFVAIKNNPTLFCDEDTHNKLAPTKQNAYCNKRSAMSVIMDHEDFKNNRNTPITETEEIQFQIVKQAEHYNFILVLDYSGSMGGQRLRTLQAACQRWIKYGVGEGNYVGIVKFESKAHRALELTKITSSNRETIANNIDTTTLGGTFIDSGVQDAILVLNGRKNCILVVMTDGQDSSPLDPNGNAKRAGCIVTTIAFGPSAADSLESLAKSTGGATFSVADGDASDTQLTDAFNFALKYQSEEDPTSVNIKIHESGPYRSTNINYNEAFVVDKNMGRNLELRLMTNNFDHITTPPVLIAPDGTRYDATDKDAISNVWIVLVKTVKSGIWQFEAGLSGNPDNFISSTVTCQPEAGGKLPITISSKTSAPIDGVDLTENQIVINVEVKQGNNPVVGAEVIAVVEIENKQKIELKLLDGGNEPDAIKGDGIYSKYLTGINENGRASIKIKVKETDNSFVLTPSMPSTRRKRDVTSENEFVVPDNIPVPCCGSVIPADRLDVEPTGDFRRIESVGSVKITKAPPVDSDSYPPTRVGDLAVENIKLKTNQESGPGYHTTFTWTAPGDDFDTGIVDKYSLRFSGIKADLSEDSFSSATEYPLPKEMYSDIFQEAGTKISLKISLDFPVFKEGVPYYFSLNAQDEKNNESPASNIVKVILPVSTPLITVTKIISSSLHITWSGSAPSITGYNVTLSTHSVDSISLELLSGVNSLGISGLRCNTEYTITVTTQADQDIKNWVNSASVNATTYDTVPGTPMIKTIKPNRDHTKLVVHWSEVEYSCSGSILNYHITWMNNNHTLNNVPLDYTTYNGTTFKYTIPNILLDSTYNVTVAARSNTGILGPMHSQTFDTIHSDSWTPGRWILCNCDIEKNHCDQCYVKPSVFSNAKKQPLSNKKTRVKRSPKPLAKLISYSKIRK